MSQQQHREVLLGGREAAEEEGAPSPPIPSLNPLLLLPRATPPPSGCPGGGLSRVERIREEAARLQAEACSAETVHEDSVRRSREEHARVRHVYAVDLAVLAHEFVSGQRALARDQADAWEAALDDM